jgi:hypothetical protein
MTAYLRSIKKKPSARHIASMCKAIVQWWSDRTLGDIRGETCRDYIDWRVQQPIARFTRGTPRNVSEETAGQELRRRALRADNPRMK